MKDRVGDFLERCWQLSQANPWRAYDGPRHGKGWIHGGTHKVRYQKARPGAHETDGEEPEEGTAQHDMFGMADVENPSLTVDKPSASSTIGDSGGDGKSPVVGSKAMTLEQRISDGLAKRGFAAGSVEAAHYEDGFKAAELRGKRISPPGYSRERADRWTMGANDAWASKAASQPKTTESELTRSDALPGDKKMTRHLGQSRTPDLANGTIVRHDGGLYVVTGSSVHWADGSGNTAEYRLRPATDEQSLPFRTKEADLALSDAYRDGNPVAVRKAENKLRGLRGESLLPELATQADAKRDIARKVLAQDFDPAGRAYKARNIIAASGLFPEVTHAVKPDQVQDLDGKLQAVIAAGDDDGLMSANNL